MSKRTALLVTGSRDWTDYAPIRERLALYPTGTILIHGDCGRIVEHGSGGYENARVYGADWIAEEVGNARKFKLWPLPYFADLGKAGGPRRNQAMIDVLVSLARAGFEPFAEAFPIDRSPGTRGCIRMIEKAPVSIRLHVTEGSL
jgi:hypothetical protein